MGMKLTFSPKAVRSVAALNPASDGAAVLYWYGGMEADHDLRRFGAHFPSFLTALDGLLTAAGRTTR